MGQHGGFHAGTAHFVDGGAPYRQGQPGGDCRLACRGLAKAGRQHTSEDEFLHLVGANAGSLDSGLYGNGTELRRCAVGEIPLEAANRGTGDRYDNYGIFGHGLFAEKMDAVYLAAIRRAPSRRMTSPFRYSFKRMCSTRAAYSAGLPIRAGNGTVLPSASCTSAGMPSSIGVSMMPGATVITRMPQRESSRASGNVIATTPPLEAA